MASKKMPDLTIARPSEEIGVTGGRSWGGHVQDEFIRELAGILGRRTYREMRENDSTIGGVFYAIENLARSVEWKVEPDDEGGEADAKFLEEVFLESDMGHTMDDFIADTFTTLVYGWSYFEVTYKLRKSNIRKPLIVEEASNDGDAPKVRMPVSKYDDGKIGIASINLRAQDTLMKWYTTRQGEVVGMQQMHPVTGEQFVIPINKALYLRSKNNRGNPEGISILRNAYRSWYMKRRIEQIEIDGIDRELTGLPVVRIPGEILAKAATGDPAARRTLETYQGIVKNVRLNQSSGIVLPSDVYESPDGQPSGDRKVDIELLTSPGQRVIDTDTVVLRHDRAIAKTILADFMMLGGSSHGNFSLAQNLSSLFITALTSFLDNVEKNINRQIVPTLWRLNGMTTNPPKLQHGNIIPNDLDALGGFLDSMIKVGAISLPDAELENRVRGIAGLPNKPDDEVYEEESLKRGKVDAEVQRMKAEAGNIPGQDAKTKSAGKQGQPPGKSGAGGGGSQKPPQHGSPPASKPNPQVESPNKKFAGKPQGKGSSRKPPR